MLYNLTGVVRQTKLKTAIKVIDSSLSEAIQSASTFADNVSEESKPTQLGKDWGK
jgi:hypothetical protein